jgi:hypothetical protein
VNLFSFRPRDLRLPAGWVRLLALGLGLAGAEIFAPTQTRAQVGVTRDGRIVPDFAAIARGALVTLPVPPPWEGNRDVSVWTVDDLKAEFAKLTDTPPRINSVRSEFLRPGHPWLVAFNRWFRAAQKPLKMHFEYQVWDCDNYANGFVAFADLLALQAGELRGSLCIGWATVSYQYPFAGIRAGGAHAVVIVGTSQGLFVLEPQGGMMVPLRDFPNRDTIEEVFF